LFSGQEGLLDSHRGWDPGALKLARSLARTFHAPLVYSTTSRLLVELNRSIGHPGLFSAITKPLPRKERERILNERYLPYRASVEACLRERVAGLGRGEAVLHVSVHTFTPELDGVVRNADAAFLYDPKRQREQRFARTWGAALKSAAPDLRIRMNYPYRGAADGLTTQLRRQFPASRYLGIELEVSQAQAAGPAPARSRMTRLLTTTLQTLLTRGCGDRM
jgi:predicted N-formylglutamate amidohydrolase